MNINPKKIFFFLLFFINAINIYSQKNQYHINWGNAKKIMTREGATKMLHFENAHHYKNTNYLPSFQISIEKKIKDVQIKNIKTIPLQEEEKRHLKGAKNMDLPIKKVNYLYEKGKVKSKIIVVPLTRSSSGTLQKISSFSIKYQSDYTSMANKRIADENNFSSHSVLSKGKWYKISIPKNGIYKIGYNQLKKMGIEAGKIDPSFLQIYGNGGHMLPQKNNAFRYDDLKENRIYIKGQEDGSFDKNDYILFYGLGPHEWNYNNNKKIFEHTYNIYSEKAFYFIKIGNKPGKRVIARSNNNPTSRIIESYTGRYFHEKELVNLLKSGREWYGEAFEVELEKNFTLPVKGIIDDSDLMIKSSVFAKSDAGSSKKTYFSLQIGNKKSFKQKISSANPGTYNIIGRNSTQIFRTNASPYTGKNSINLTYKYQRSQDPVAIGYLNYYTVNYQKQLKLYGDQTKFRIATPDTGKKPTYRISGKVDNNTLIWDVTHHINVKDQQYNLSSDKIEFTGPGDTLREYVVFAPDKINNSPSFVGKVENQDLHGMEVPDLLIVSPPELMKQAQKYGEFRRNTGYDVNVVSTRQIYNEFSSGAQDITAIRDFCRMFYKRGQNEENKFKYLLLFGDASYDYKDRVSNNTNLVPVYEARESIHPIQSYSSDDYYGFLDPEEGFWKESGSGDHIMDIGIGRFPVKNSREAKNVFKKVKNYETCECSLGKWRNKVTFAADDGDNNLHQKQSDELATNVDTTYDFLNLEKIYLDAFKQEITPSGEVAPQVNDAIDQTVNKGTLLFNYTGHGGVGGMAEESIINTSMINDWNNFNRLSFFVTATCSFGKYDDPSVVSAGERVVLNPDGGGVGLITTTRPVFSRSNFKLNKQFYNRIFKTNKQGEFYTLGEVHKFTKNNALNGPVNRNYALLSDPSMKLNYPSQKAEITSVNGNETNDTTSTISDTAKALCRVTMKGEIRNKSNDKVMTNFNGKIHTTVFDKKQKRKTFGTNKSQEMTFKEQNNIIQDGISSVSNGKFSFTFVVPKDISYKFGRGKVSLYAYEQETNTDASGAFEKFIVGGSCDSVNKDNDPPQLSLFINDTTFVNGGTTGKNPELIGKLSDENGINVVGTGVGHEIIGYLSGKNLKKEKKIILNDFYTSELNNHKKGEIRYQLNDLEEGRYRFRVIAWDTHNNMVEDEISFFVVSEEELYMENVMNYPNPFSGHTTFQLDHNRPGDNLKITVEIYTVTGKLIRTLEKRIMNSNTHIDDLHWNGKDRSGDNIGKGVYVYKVTLKSLTDGSEIHDYQKLHLLR